MPYYPWFVKDFRANRKVQRMNHIERGLYRELLDECWEEGYIQDDPIKLAEICNCPAGVMVEAWPKIRPCFTPLDMLDGMYLQNLKLEEVRTRIESKRIQQRLAGQASAMKRMNGRSTDVQRSLTDVQRSSTIKENKSKAKENKSICSTPVEQDGPAAASLLQALAAGPCAWCGQQPPAHLPSCKPQRVAGPIDG